MLSKSDNGIFKSGYCSRERLWLSQRDDGFPQGVDGISCRNDGISSRTTGFRETPLDGGSVENTGTYNLQKF